MEPLTAAKRLGALFAENGILWVMTPAKGPVLFLCGHTSATEFSPDRTASPRHTVAGLTAWQLPVRKTVMPFTRPERLEAVLPQEATDALLFKQDTPHLAFHAHRLDTDSEVFYAAAPKRVLEDALANYGRHGITPGSMVVSELAGWPLLEAAGMLGKDETTLVLDGSAIPHAIFVVSQGRISSFRLFRPHGTAHHDTIVEEIELLLGPMLTGPPPISKAICLGDDQPTYRRLLHQHGVAEINTPALPDLGSGLAEWKYIRPAGLALAARNADTTRLLDFRRGKFAYQENWKPWLTPWQPAVLVFVLWLTATLVQQGWHYFTLKKETVSQQTRIETMFRHALPHVPVLIDPHKQLQQAVDALNTHDSADTLSLSHWIFLLQKLPPDFKVDWLQLHYDQEGVALVGEVDSYEDLERLRSILQTGSKITSVEVEEAQFIARTQRVQFTLKMF